MPQGAAAFVKFVLWTLPKWIYEGGRWVITTGAPWCLDTAVPRLRDAGERTRTALRRRARP